MATDRARNSQVSLPGRCKRGFGFFGRISVRSLCVPVQKTQQIDVTKKCEWEVNTYLFLLFLEQVGSSRAMAGTLADTVMIGVADTNTLLSWNREGPGAGRR